MERSPTHGINCSARVTTHIPSMKNLETMLKLPFMKIKSTSKQINIIATQYAHSILVHKRRLENQQPITDLQDLGPSSMCRSRSV